MTSSAALKRVVSSLLGARAGLSPAKVVAFFSLLKALSLFPVVRPSNLVQFIHKEDCWKMRLHNN